MSYNQTNKNMKVTLNIENDAELRAYIKDCIKGQVLAIVREDFEQIVKEELTRKLKGSWDRNFEKMTEYTMQKAIKDILYKEHNITDWSSRFIEPYIKNILNPHLVGKDWLNIVDKLAKEKVKELLEKSI
jgi:hypothetical protein